MSVRAFDTGGGSIVLSLDRLDPSTGYAAALYGGTCPVHGSRVVDLGTLTPSGSGTVSVTVTLDVPQVAAVRAAASGTDRASVAIGTGSKARCATLLTSLDVTSQVWFEPLPYIRTRTVASVTGTPAPAGGTIAATGTLRTVDGDPVAEASVVLTATPRDGCCGVLEFRGTVPAGAAHALITLGANAEGVGPGPADLTFYEVGYSEGDAEVNLVPNARFDHGSLDWDETSGDGSLTVVPSDRGAGRMLRIVVTPDQWLYSASGSFTVTPGAAFRTWTAVRVPETSIDTAYIAPIFFATDWTEVGRDVHPIGPVPIPLGAHVTDAAGTYTLTVGPLEPGRYGLLTEYAGNAAYWPTRAKTELTVP